MAVKEYQGGCLCNHIRFIAKGDARHPHTCSCTICQRHSGSLTVPWIEFDKSAVEWTGPGGEPSLYRSSDFSCRAFCPTCGSSLGAIDDGPTVGLLLGNFDKKSIQALKPVAHSYKSSRPRWWKVEIT